jgi:hypothetical protein
MGGKPSTATPADMRLAENKAKASGGSSGSSGGSSTPSGFTNKPWDGSANRWPDAASYADSSLINLNTGARSNWTKGNVKLPYKEPDGTVNVNAVHAAAAALAGGRGGVQASPQAKRAAAKKLVSLYAQMKQDVPQAIKQMAM